MFDAQTIRDRRAARKSELACAPCLFVGTESGVANTAITVVHGTAVCEDHLVSDEVVNNALRGLEYSKELGRYV